MLLILLLLLLLLILLILLLLFYKSFKKLVSMLICITEEVVRLIMGCVDHFRIVVRCCSSAGLTGLSFFVEPPLPP